MNKRERFALAAVFALLAAGVTLVMVQAKAEAPAPAVQEQEPLNCSECHQDFQMEWASGAHSSATNDPIFAQAWADQGQPGACMVCHVTGYDPGTGTWEQDGVACTACHNPVPTNHPEEPMPVQDTTELCGQCHSDARFGWQEWQTSTHYQRGMDCTVCHDPHSASLKNVEGLEAQGPSGLCVNCHRDYNMDFPYSNHAMAGLNCVDCHLRHFGSSGGRTIHTMPDHSFTASLTSCTSCHDREMHGPTDAATGAEITTQAVVPATNGALAEEPAPVSPYGFAGLAGLLGLAGGMVLAPWLERAYRKLSQKEKSS
ncbi:MAG: hypothetical protein JXB85_02390 [Anaerolineales bacterium]|nr:hypothetical protein [Anaerolineales bacterium]